MQEIVYNKHISITINEITDVCARAAVNVLFSFGNQTKLVKTEFLDIVNNTTIAQLVMRTLQFYNVSYDNLIFFISDNAAYMLKAFQILSSLIPQLKHNRCLAHILNLVGETWINYKSFKFLVNIVANIKKSFIHSPARKKRWIVFLKSFISSTTTPPDQNSITLPPLPVKTRWNSWFKFVFWINQHIPQICKFYIEEETINNESEAIRELATIFKNSAHIFTFEILVMFISFNAKR
jgi:hypothetical protein